MLARALLGFIWKLQLWLLEGGWGHSNYAAVKLVWNILTQMQIESKWTSPSQWICWGLSRKLLVLMSAYWQQGVEFLLLLLLVLECKQTAPKRQVNQHILHFFYCSKLSWVWRYLIINLEEVSSHDGYPCHQSSLFSLTQPGIISRIFAMCYLQSSLDFFFFLTAWIPVKSLKSGTWHHSTQLRCNNHIVSMFRRCLVEHL